MRPDGDELIKLFTTVGEALARHARQLDTAPAEITEDPDGIVDRVAAAPGEQPREVDDVFAELEQALRLSVETAGPQFLSHISGGGDLLAAAADALALGFNRFGTFSVASRGMTAMENGVLAWMAGLFGFPAPPVGGGLLTTGGSQAIMSALLCARDLVDPDDLPRARVYLSDAANHVVAKMAHVVGLGRAVRVLPTKDGRTVAPEVLAAAIAEDRAAGLRPVAVVANAGTTNTGDVDPLRELGEIAHAAGAWYHVDACYGGFFALTEDGRRLLAGIELADSISLDPHKTLFLPLGIGALIVRDGRALAAAHTPGGDAVGYFRDLDLPPTEFAAQGTELSRGYRAQLVWVALRARGLGYYRAALVERMSMARYLAAELGADERFEVPHEPTLSIVLVRLRAGDAATQAMVDRISAARKFAVASTEFNGQVYLRIVVLAHRLRWQHVDEVLAAIRAVG